MSNESAQRVFFDNLVIHHNKGHLLEEDQYYPFGLKMAGISDQALPAVPNNYLYNGKELQQNEFSDGTSLEDYDYGFRGYDPQLGRFTEQDPLTDEFATVSGYQYALNDPVANIDMDGLAVLPTVSVFAAAVNRMSAFSSFTSSILSEASLASKVINFTSLGAHVLQTGRVLGLSWLTRSVGTDAADGLIGGPGHGNVAAKSNPTKDNAGPWTVGWEWLTGTGPRVHHFKEGDYFTELLKKQEWIEETRRLVIKKIKNNQIELNKTYYNNYSLGGLGGIPKYIKDYSTLFTGGLMGNLAGTFLGSYNLNFKVISINKVNHTAITQFHVYNASTVGSATHLPILGYLPEWNKYIAKPLNKFFSKGPLSETTQTFDWTETISW